LIVEKVVLKKETWAFLLIEVTYNWDDENSEEKKIKEILSVLPLVLGAQIYKILNSPKSTIGLCPVDWKFSFFRSSK